MMQEFYTLEASAGILLMIGAALALLLQNSPAHEAYTRLLSYQFIVQVGPLIINKSLLLWINDALMAIFFLLIALEMKREILVGQLSKKDKLVLPFACAIGGLVLPAGIYALFNYHDPVAITGWAIPAATDIAFTLAVLSLLSNKIPRALKVTLVAIAIMDDLAAIVIIAGFYTEHLSYAPLLLSFCCVLVMLIVQWSGMQKLYPYLILGLILWVFVLKSGVHATLAGVATGLAIPLRGSSHSPLEYLEHKLHPWVSFGIMPIFAFANSGVSLQGFEVSTLYNSITLGIICGLFFGKQIGIMLMALLSTKLGFAKMPKEITWKQFYGMSILTGIGFTMSLFIGNLAFTEYAQINAVRLGVIFASILAGICGYIILLSTKAVCKT